MTSSTDTTRQIKLSSRENQLFPVDLDVAMMSSTIKTMLDNLGSNGTDDSDDVIPIPNVKTDTLRRVVEWCTHHRNDPAPVEEENSREKRSDDIGQWDQDFLRDIGQSPLFDLILAANYLDIKGLLDVTCKTVANMIKGKTAEEIRLTFNITNDFTPAEEEQIRKENEWCEEK